MKRILLVMGFAVAACASAEGGQTGDEGALSGNDDGGLPAFFPRDEAAQVIIAAGYKPCTEDAECVLVGTSCNHCCGRDSVRASLEAQYRVAFAASCEDYSGPVCDCDTIPAEPRCIDHRCTAAPP